MKWWIAASTFALCVAAHGATMPVSPSVSSAVDWFKLFTGLFGGLALFLFGLDQMAQGLQAAAGESMKVVLRKLTKNRLLGALTGALVTAVLNSSSVTTVLVVGFVTAGMMTLAQSIGVIMGANVGSTFTAQIVAFNVTRYALAMVAIGFAMTFSGRRDLVKQVGLMLMGLGLIFFGMGLMGQAMEPLGTFEPFLDLMRRMDNPFLGLLVGAVFTGLVQSSAATTSIAIVMASQGLVALPAGIALALGANVGTCVTAVLASIGKPREAQRAAAAHVIFNVAGVLLWVGFIPYLAELVVRISPSSPGLSGSARMAAEVPRQIANAHTVFNIANTLLFIGFTGVFARVVEWMLPDKPPDETALVEVKYLDESLVTTPALALQRVRMEIGHMGRLVQDMLGRIPMVFRAGSHRELDDIRRTEDQVDYLQERILRYLGQIRRQPMTKQDSRDFIALMSVSQHLESIADVIDTNLVDAAHKIVESGIRPSATTDQSLGRLYEAVSLALGRALAAVSDSEKRDASEALTVKHEINRLLKEATRHQAEMLASGDDRRPEIFRLEMSVMDSLKRIYTLTKRIAKAILPKDVGKAIDS